MVAFWDYELALQDNSSENPNNSKTLNITCVKQVEMPEGIFCAKFSPNGKYLALGLMDFTVKIYFADTMKLYLSLYGHKVLTLFKYVILTLLAPSDVFGYFLRFYYDCHWIG